MNDRAAPEVAPRAVSRAAPPAVHAVPGLHDFLGRVVERPGGFDLFQTLRRIDALNRERPCLGDALRPGDEPIRFVEEPTLTFAVGAISGVDWPQAKAPQLRQRVLGFLGPNGALPIHLTEYARERVLHFSDPTFGAFLNTLLNRFGLFFYRAWARAQPVVSLDRPGDAPIVRHVGALFGHAEVTQRGRDALGDVRGDFAKLHFVGRLARQVRDADGLEAWVRSHFGVPVAVEQFRGHWMPLAREERSRLRRDGQHGLGRGAVLGRAVWDVQHKFRLVIGPLPWPRFTALLPGGGELEQLQAMVRQYVGFEFDWDVRLILAHDDVPDWPLGRTAGAPRGVGRLGRTSWFNGRRARRGAGDADDLVMNVEGIRHTPPAPQPMTTMNHSDGEQS